MTKKKMICVAILVLFVGAVFYILEHSGTKEASRKQETDTFGALSFYNDNILYTSCWGGLHITNYCRLVSYDPFTKESKIIRTTNNFQGGPIYSWEGKKIAYANVEQKRDASNICVMDADGSNHRQLTYDYNDEVKTTDTPTGKVQRVIYNHFPSFSRDGKRIIFARASMKRQRILGYGDMYTAWDIFEIDLETKAVKQLTNYRFYEISRPFYLSDDKRFVSRVQVRSCRTYRQHRRWISGRTTRDSTRITISSSWTAEQMTFALPLPTADGPPNLLSRRMMQSCFLPSPTRWMVFLQNPRTTTCS